LRSASRDNAFSRFLRQAADERQLVEVNRDPWSRKARYRHRLSESAVLQAHRGA
jgi:hypothetical protein